MFVNLSSPENVPFSSHCIAHLSSPEYLGSDLRNSDNAKVYCVCYDTSKLRNISRNRKVSKSIFSPNRNTSELESVRMSGIFKKI